MPERTHLEEGAVGRWTLQGIQGQAAGAEEWGIWWDMGKGKVWQEKGAAVGKFDPEGLWTQ